MKEIRSVKEQYQIKDACLKERLELILPKVMKEYDVDMWISASKEYNEDPLFHAITPAIIQLHEDFIDLALLKEGIIYIVFLSVCQVRN